MISELKLGSQVTVPKEIILNMGLKEGDKFEVFQKDGIICFVPTVVYSDDYLEELKSIVVETKADYRTGKIKGFSDIGELISDLDKL
ncbi:MAG: AbrB/MazE/SpoVT family DNA-binding domain-containing protein [Ruminococcus sp.]|jgi:AbrB family looped-hinge helix DNA binding protein|nr:AbrB/MazE/SpoVT family DNA-binding domain-containing protein [Ruminococcus sp.]